MTALDALGWAGSALLVYSLLQTRVLRLRVLNGIASAVLLVFNVLIEVWPMVGLNLALTAINAWYVVRLLRGRHQAESYEIVDVAPSEGYVRHVLGAYERDIARYNPGFARGEAHPGEFGFLITTGAETVGVVLARDLGDGTAQVTLDYVLPRFRDFTPGEFVYRPGGPFAARGFRRAVAPPRMQRADDYLARVGFRRQDDAGLVLDLAR